MKEEIFNQVKEIIKEALFDDSKEIKPEDHLVTDLNFDSLDLVSLVTDLEDKFSVKIEEEDIEKVATVNDIVALIEKIKRKKVIKCPVD